MAEQTGFHPHEASLLALQRCCERVSAKRSMQIVSHPSSTGSGGHELVHRSSPSWCGWASLALQQPPSIRQDTLQATPPPPTHTHTTPPPHTHTHTHAPPPPTHTHTLTHTQVAERVRTDPRLTLLERTNLRLLTLQDLPDARPCQLATLDLSFIALTTVLPAVVKLLAPQAHVVALIKPQFEAARDQVGLWTGCALGLMSVRSIWAMLVG